MVEPFAIALHAVRRSPPELNDAVVVVGAGMIGLALVQALSQSGCGRLIAVDMMEDRLARASALGATDIVNSAKVDPVPTLLEMTNGKGANRCFEAVGVSATVDLALRCVRKGGAITLVGNVTPKVEFPLQVAVTRELSIFGSCASQGEYPACLEMLARGS